MKKLGLIVLGLLALTAIAYAGQLGQTATGYTSCTQVSVSNSSPVELTGNLGNPRALVWSVKVTNLDGSASLCVSQDPSVSCSSGAHHGEVIGPASAAPFHYLSWIIAVTEPWYAISSGGGATNAQVCLTQ